MGRTRSIDDEGPDVMMVPEPAPPHNTEEAIDQNIARIQEIDEEMEKLWAEREERKENVQRYRATVAQKLDEAGEICDRPRIHPELGDRQKY